LVSDIKGRNRLRVFENRVLKIIFGPKRDGVVGSWRKFHIEEPHKWYSSPIISNTFKEGDIGRACNTNSKTMDACSILVGKSEGNRPVERPRLG
jgi:hypothetical protein